jgi:hypothetical protein
VALKQLLFSPCRANRARACPWHESEAHLPAVRAAPGTGMATRGEGVSVPCPPELFGFVLELRDANGN